MEQLLVIFGLVCWIVFQVIFMIGCKQEGASRTEMLQSLVMLVPFFFLGAMSALCFVITIPAFSAYGAYRLWGLVR
jgi:hypothetical protein